MEFDNCTLDITYRCNSNCVFCFTWNRIKTEKNFSEIIKTLILLRKKWLTVVSLSWWEPTLHHDLVKIIYYTKRLWYTKIHLVSNWSKFGNKKYLLQLIENGLNIFTISLHWSNYDIHDKITNRKWSYLEIISGLSNLSLLKNDYNFSYWINFTVFEGNFHDVIDTLILISSKYKNIDFFNLHFDKKFINNTDKDKINELIKTISAYIADVDFKLKVFNLPICYATWFEYLLEWDYNKIRYWDIYPDFLDQDLKQRIYKNECEECLYKNKCYWFYK